MMRKLLPVLIVAFLMATHSCYLQFVNPVDSSGQKDFHFYVGDTCVPFSSMEVFMNQAEDTLVFWSYLKERGSLSPYCSCIVMVPEFDWENNTETSLPPECVNVWYREENGKNKRMVIRSALFTFDNSKKGREMWKYHLKATFSIDGTIFMANQETGEEVHLTNGYFELEEDTAERATEAIVDIKRIFRTSRRMEDLFNDFCFVNDEID